MWRPLLSCFLIGCWVLPAPAMIEEVRGVPIKEAVCVSTHMEDPEIDRSPIWAIQYRRYLYLLGREMFWPELASREAFRIAVVGWPDLADNLGSKLDGRAIAGLPVDIVSLDEESLASERGDFTVLFLGGTSRKASDNEGLQRAVNRWNRKDNKQALIITDGGDLDGFDLILKRRKIGNDPQLCIVQDTDGLSSKGMTLPVPFLQKLCP